MATIIITEQQEELLMNLALQEGFNQDYGSKVLRIKEYLDKHYKKGSMPSKDENGRPSKQEIVMTLDCYGRPESTKTDAQLLDDLEDYFKDTLPKSERRDFLKKVMIAWYYNNISKNGTIVDKSN